MPPISTHDAAVYVGLSALDYSRLSARYARAAASVYSATGSLALSVAPGRIAYAFGMNKAAVAVDTGVLCLSDDDVAQIIVYVPLG